MPKQRSTRKTADDSDSKKPSCSDPQVAAEEGVAHESQSVDGVCRVSDDDEIGYHDASRSRSNGKEEEEASEAASASLFSRDPKKVMIFPTPWRPTPYHQKRRTLVSGPSRTRKWSCIPKPGTDRLPKTSSTSYANAPSQSANAGLSDST